MCEKQTDLGFLDLIFVTAILKSLLLCAEQILPKWECGLNIYPEKDFQK